MAPLIPFYTINNVSISAKRSNFTLSYLEAAFHANPGAKRKREGSSSYISRRIFQKFSNTSGNNNVSPWIYKSWYSPKFFISKTLETLSTSA